jgi:hypothetical protein
MASGSSPWGQRQGLVPSHTLGPSGSKEADLLGRKGWGRREGEGRHSCGKGEGAAGLRALSDQRAQYFIAGKRSQDINYLGRAALKAF